MKKEELEMLDPEILVRNYRRAIELRISANGNGKSPFDEKQLEEEIVRRVHLAEEVTAEVGILKRDLAQKKSEASFQAQLDRKGWAFEIGSTG